MTPSKGLKPDQQRDFASRDVSYAVGIGRIVWRSIAVVALGRVHRVLGISYLGNDYGVWVKAFGFRDIILGLAALHPDAVIRSANLRAGIILDVVDAAMVADAQGRIANCLQRPAGWRADLG